MTEQTTQGAPAAAPAAPTPGSPEYDAAMAARYREAKGLTQDGTAAPAGNEIERAAAFVPAPQDAPSKFVKDGQLDVAALLASYTALEKAQGARPTAPAATPAAAPAAAPGDQPEPLQDPAAQAAAAQAAVQKAGLDWNTLAAKAAKGEAFSEQEYAALEGAGMPKAVADSVAKALNDRQVAEKAAAIEYAGGQAEADKLLGWAAANLSEAEKAAINQQLASPMWRLAIDAVKARMASAKPTAGEPTLTVGGTAPGTPSGYRSRAEMKADMASPSYTSDPAFREKVALKMRFATWDLD